MPKKKHQKAHNVGFLAFAGALAFAIGSFGASESTAYRAQTDPFAQNQDPFGQQNPPQYTQEEQDALFEELLRMNGQQTPESQDPFPFTDYNQQQPNQQEQYDPNNPFGTPAQDPFYPSAPAPEDAFFPAEPTQTEPFVPSAPPLPEPSTLPVTAPLQLAVQETPFADEPIDSPANILRERGIVHGFPDGTFGGKKPINRAETLKILVHARMGSVPTVPVQTDFSDAPRTAWYTPYLAFGSYYGIMTGYADGTVRPEKQVTTAEFLKIISMTFGLPTNLPYGFIDVKESDWFHVYAGAAEHYGMWPVRGPLLAPGQPLTRGEVAEAIVAVMGL